MLGLAVCQPCNLHWILPQGAILSMARVVPNCPGNPAPAQPHLSPALRPSAGRGCPAACGTSLQRQPTPRQSGVNRHGAGGLAAMRRKTASTHQQQLAPASKPQHNISTSTSTSTSNCTSNCTHPNMCGPGSCTCHSHRSTARNTSSTTFWSTRMVRSTTCAGNRPDQSGAELTG